MILNVGLGERAYDIVIERGCLAKAGALCNLDRKVLVVTDSGVPLEYARTVADQCAEAHGFKLRRKKKEFDSMALAAACQKKKDEKFRQLHPELFPNG